ncbi:MAG: HD domain-containing protein, partial [Treponema sp.]|nr:HD domain-containing protein [Candidatus Treponema equifaecale]
YIILIKTMKRKASSGLYVALFSCVLLESFGYVQLSFAKSVEAAILANNFVYFGGVANPLFCFLCIADLCKEKSRKLLAIPFVVLTISLMGLTSTIGKLPFYYKTVELIQTPGLSRLVRTYGPLHFIYPTYMCAAIIACFGVIIKSFKSKRQVSYFTSMLLLGNMSLLAIVYFMERLLHIQIELMPAAFLIMQISVLVLLNRINSYDMWSISSASISESKKFGFVLFNSKGKLYGSDSVARTWFPELNELFIDRQIKSAHTEFLQLIQKWISEPNFKEVKYFERDDKIIETRLTIVHTKGKYSIYCINLRDDTEQQKLARLMQNYNNALETRVEEKTSQLAKVQNDIILNMASTVESRDANTGGHIRRTSDVVKIFVEHLVQTQKFPQLTKEFANCVIKAAPLHDFGKIGIPDMILNKPGKFEPEEYEIMKLHAEKGSVIVSKILQNSDDIKFREIAVNVAHFHHEKWDGNGYPNKLSGETIPFEARIMALADVFDALVSKRVYKDSFGYDKAFNIIEESCGSHFDPVLCPEFLKCRPQLEALFNSYGD